MKHLLLLLSLPLVLFASNALAGDAAVKKSFHGVEYLTGGISEEGVDAIRPHAKKFSLHLVFSEGAVGRWATDVNVNIYDADGKLVFRIVRAQPHLLVNLPAGTYTVLASYNGDKLRHKFTLEADQPQKVILNWKNEVEEESLDAGEQ